MRKNFFFAIGVVVIIIINAIAFSQKNHHQKFLFNIDTSNQTFEFIQKNLGVRNDYASIALYVRQMEDLEGGAKKCVNDSESHLKTISDLLKSTEVDRVSQLQRADIQYLQGKQIYYVKQLSECRLFVYRSQEALINYKDVMQKLSANQILERITPLWKINKINWLQSINEFDIEKSIAISGFNLISSNQRILGFILLLLTMGIAFYLKVFLKQVILEIENTHLLLRAFLSALSKYVVPCAFFGFTSAFLNLIFQDISPTPTLELTSHAALILMLLLALSKFIFYPSRSLPGIFIFPDKVGRMLYRGTVFLVAVLFTGYICALILREQALPLSLIELLRTVFVTIIAGIVAWIFMLWYRSVHEMNLRNANFVLFSMMPMFTLSSLVVIEWLGYHRLAIFLISGLFLTLIFTVIAVLAWRFIDALYEWIDNKQYALSRKVHQTFGVKYNKKMHEISLIKLSAYFAILSLYVVAILKSWSISPIFVDLIVNGLFYGFKFSGLTIIPSRMVFALISFSVLLLIGRFIATSIAKKHRFKGEEDTQIAISTITIYVSFAIALIFSMLVTGVDFTGLAIIAGALSVGVGMGLQNIVNNFVSGLILLIEKPIKPGDRIVIGKTEGFVRKIRIRSTQIATLSKEDVIVPNADLITQQVTNYMFRDRNSRVVCQVGVAYGSDIDLVKKLLLEMAEKHDDVVHEAPNEPLVLFSRFGESALIFDLWCVIHDVNKKYIVVSDLNFAIDAAFRHHKITIALPQRELHIKDYVAVKKDA